MKPLVVSLLLASASACTTITPLADEHPYKEMIGQCYLLQQAMAIRENACWELGASILSPDESTFCFKGTLARVEKGTAIRIVDVQQQRFGETGLCPQITVNVETVPEPSRAHLPLCHSREYLSWLEKPLWRRGEPISLREEFAVPCTTK